MIDCRSMSDEVVSPRDDWDLCDTNLHLSLPQTATSTTTAVDAATTATAIVVESAVATSPAVSAGERSPMDDWANCEIDLHLPAVPAEQKAAPADPNPLSGKAGGGAIGEGGGRRGRATGGGAAEVDAVEAGAGAGAGATGTLPLKTLVTTYTTSLPAGIAAYTASSLYQ